MNLKEENMQPLLVAFGNPLLDITAVVKDKSLHSEFQLPIDGQLEVNDRQRDLFNLVMKKYPVEYTAGGCALNSSRVFGWVLGEPQKVVFVGGIGKDERAKRLSTIVQQSGVITRFVEVDEPTGSCMCLVLGACRCLCADIGAANICEPEHVFNPQLLPVLEAAQYIYIEGYFITHSFPTALQIARYSQQHNKTLVFNLCGSYVCENHPNEMEQLLPYVDILFGFVEEYKTLDKHVNIDELSSKYVNSPNNITHDISKVLRAVRGEEDIIQDDRKQESHDHIVTKTETLEISVDHFSHCNGVTSNGVSSEMSNGVTNGCSNNSSPSKHTNNSQKQKIVVVTKGPSPLLYVHNHIVRERSVPPIAPKDIVDTTGAGDSFVAGFLAAISKNESVSQCLDCGTWTAQQLLQQKGCTIPSTPATFLSRT